MKYKFIAAFMAALFASLTFVYAQKSKSVLNAEINANFPDQNTGAITPAQARTTFNDFVSSWQNAPVVNMQVGTSYTVSITDYGKLITFNNASPVAVTLPNPLSGFTPFNFLVLNIGTGTVTITPIGATINGSSTYGLLSAQSNYIISDGTNYQIGQSVGTGQINNSNFAPMTQNAVKGAATSTAVADLSVPSCSTGSSALQWTSNVGLSCGTINPGRPVNPINLYVATTGSDGQNCTLIGSPCLTLQRAINVALTYDFQGASLTINLAAGTYTSGGYIGGPLPGAGQNGAGATLIILGAGSGSTTLGVTNCSSGGNGSGVFISGAANVQIGSMTITTTCGGTASDIFLYQGGRGSFANADVILGAATWAKIDANTQSQFNAGFATTFTGNGQYGFLVGANSTIISNGVTVTGSPTLAAGFVGVIDNSVYDSGGVTMTGTMTGPRYNMNNSGTIDTEQNVNAFPGSTLGVIGNNSVYYTGATNACVGGAGGCPVVTGPTGLGTGSAAISAGSGDWSGDVVLTAGTGAAATGVVHVSPKSDLQGPAGCTAFCTTTISNVGTAWTAGATTQAYFLQSSSAPDIVITWFNNAVALTNTGNYNIVYMCR
jgi:hypothetical protein